MIVFADGAVADLERIFEFHLEFDEATALAQVTSIESAVRILELHPHIGRRTRKPNLRELVISRGKSGYLALYQFDRAQRLIRVLAIRHQREAGYRDSSK